MGSDDHPDPEHRHGDDVLTPSGSALLLALAAPTHAEPVRLTATIADDLRSVHGTLELPADTELIDPLALLPTPEDDLHLLRTFPGAPNQGEITWEPAGEGRYTFEARLPKRYDDIGWTHEGLLANGAWYPQPTSDEDPLPILDWEVQVTLPDGRVGALGDTADQGTLTWTGRADRVPLAVLRRARLTQLGGDHWSVDLLTPGRARPVLVRELVRSMDEVATADRPLHGVLVEGPLRRRLVRPGPGLAFLSDRAYRLTPPLQRFHRVSVVRGIAASFIDQPDPFLRDVAGAAIGLDRAEDLKGIDADRLLQAFKWIPQVHWLLVNQRMPFYADVLERPHPSDPVRDDLAELLEPTSPGTVVMIQAVDRFGFETASVLGTQLAMGVDPREAEAKAGVPDGWLDTWRVPYPEQDYVVTIDEVERAVTVERIAPEDAPEETATVRINGEDYTWTGGPGSQTFTLSEPPQKVQIDPYRHLAQTSRMKDAWPDRYFLTLSAGITSINATRFQVFGAGSMTLRRAYDTHNLWRGTLYNSFADLVGARVSWLHQEGRRRGTGWSRVHGVSVWVNGSVLNPNFAATDGLQTAWGTGVSYGWDTRVAGDFPLRGKRLGGYVSTGFVPGLGESWVHTGPSAVGVVPLHPRHALALFASATAAISNVPHRKLSVGGHSVMRSLPSLPACPSEDPCQTLADQRAMAAFEYRFAPLRNVSVPLLLAWGSELQLTAGLEGLAARVEGEPATALGATAGVAGIADLLGAEPYLGGITVGWPLLWSDALTGVDQEGWPEIYLRWSQEF